MKVKHIKERCTNCGICKDLVMCPLGSVRISVQSDACVGCGSCTIACPNNALVLEKDEGEEFEVFLDDKPVNASGTIKDALIKKGFEITKFPTYNSDESEKFFIPCGCGACCACMVEVDGKVTTACITPLFDGMSINTHVKRDIPLREVSGFGLHSAGGVGTPYNLKFLGRPIEVAVFAHGCNLRCPQCQNYGVAFTASGNLLESIETAKILIGLKQQHKLNRIAISGGESTLNRKWLLDLINNINKMDKNVNIHVDTNGTILTLDYIDDLIQKGMTDVGIDLKALKVSTFLKITGLEDEKLAKKYLETSWAAVKYINRNYMDEVFMGVGIPYNKELISSEEIMDMGNTLFKINPEIQISILDYRPEFRRKDITRPLEYEMLELKSLLNDIGLKTVIVQTKNGYIGP